MKSVIPNRSAIARLAGLTSTPTIWTAPAMPRALDDVEADPAEPEHGDASTPGSTPAVQIAAPMPVVTPQPI